MVAESTMTAALGPNRESSTNTTRVEVSRAAKVDHTGRQAVTNVGRPTLQTPTGSQPQFARNTSQALTATDCETPESQEVHTRTPTGKNCSKANSKAPSISGGILLVRVVVVLVLVLQLGASTACLSSTQTDNGKC